jgi:hypothetical protein
MNDHPNLERLQRWLLAVTTHPHGVAAGVGSDAAQREIPAAMGDVERIISRSRHCTGEERLAVYSHAYYARLLECLTGEFDAVAKAAGAEAFTSLCAAYLQTYPPGSYTLSQLGARFPQYLQETRPPRQPDAAQPDWADLLIDLARLERTYAEVFDGPGEEGDSPLDAAQLQQTPPGEWGALRLRLTASLRLLELRFPVHEYFTVLRRSADAAPPSPRPVTLAIHRRNYTVQRRELSPVQAALIRSLQSPLPLGEALEQTATQSGADPSAFAAELRDWFHDWTAAGIFCGVSASPATAASAAVPPQSPSRP